MFLVDLAEVLTDETFLLYQFFVAIAVPPVGLILHLLLDVPLQLGSQALLPRLQFPELLLHLLVQGESVVINELQFAHSRAF